MLKIDPTISRVTNRLRVLQVTGAVVRQKAEMSSLLDQLREESQALSRAFDPSSVPFAIWQEVYRKMGANPKREIPCHQALMSRINKKGWTFELNPIVELYLHSQIRFNVPHGANDLDRLSGSMVLRYALPGEEIEIIGRSGPEILNPFEICYADGQGPLTRWWNYREARRASVQDSTRNFVVTIELLEGQWGLTEQIFAAILGYYRTAFDGDFWTSISDLHAETSNA